MIKSKVFFSRNIMSKDLDLFSGILGIKVSISFGKYLDFPIFHKRATNEDFQFIIDNMDTRLAGWKTKFLNMLAYNPG